jgi:hypothetical protein
MVSNLGPRADRLHLASESGRDVPGTARAMVGLSLVMSSSGGWSHTARPPGSSVAKSVSDPVHP